MVVAVRFRQVRAVGYEPDQSDRHLTQRSWMLPLFWRRHDYGNPKNEGCSSVYWELVVYSRGFRRDQEGLAQCT